MTRTNKAKICNVKKFEAKKFLVAKFKAKKSKIPRRPRV
jgi:hypothetical protein